MRGFSFAYPNCLACHSLNLSKKELKEKLQAYRKGQGSPMMVNIAKNLSDEELKEVIETYGK